METVQPTTAPAGPAAAEKASGLLVVVQQGAPLDAVTAILDSAGMQQIEASAIAAGGSINGSAWPYAIVHAEPLSQDVATYLEQAGCPHVLFLYRRPESAALAALAESNCEGVAQALSEWHAAVEAMLALFRRNRRRITLVDAEAALANPQTFASQLSTRTGATIETMQAPSESAAVSAQLMDRAIATFAAQNTAAVQELTGELEASSLALAREVADPIPPVDDLLAAYAEQREVREHTLSQLQDENELLLLQLHQVQEEFEQYFLENQDKDKRFTELRNEKAKLEKTNRYLEDQLERATRNLEDIKKSLSWRLTVPLRSLRGGPRRRSETSEEG